MPKIAYIPKAFRSEKAETIDQANSIFAEYAELDMIITARQMYYQFVARDLFSDDRRWIEVAGKWKRHPEGTKNAPPNYSFLAQVLSQARLAGLIDWNCIEDRTRFIRYTPHFDSPEEMIQAAAHQFRIDKWESQDHHVEVLIEKDALVGVIEPVCRQLDITYASCRGYMSQSMMWTMAMRLKGYAIQGKQILIIHLGDHDPSGKQMSDDIEDRLRLFLGTKQNKLEVNRIALNMDQIEEFNPPPNPAKMKDPRANAYVEEFGNESWELDALDPKTIADLIRNTVKEVRDESLWYLAVQRERDERKKMRAISENYVPVSEYVESEGFIDSVEDEPEEED